MGIILQSEKLTKTYNEGKENQVHVLKNVDLSIKTGEFVAVMGPSGSGKSTLLYNISGMDQMTAGSVLFKGQEIADLTEKELAKLRLHHMGFIFQQHHLLKNLSIYENIILAAYLAKKAKEQNLNKRAMDLMKKLGITELRDHDITQASGGQLQRVAISRALMNNPDIIFGDEPTGALNSKSAFEVMEILREINESGTTILLVTHDVKVAARTERILYMLDGNLVGEKRLGKYKLENDDLKLREDILSRWLIKQGF